MKLKQFLKRKLIIIDYCYICISRYHHVYVYVNARISMKSSTINYVVSTVVVMYNYGSKRISVYWH